MASTTLATPPRLTVLGDGTATVPGHRGEVRLSQDRTRWWDGVAWELTATSTPPHALHDPSGRRWWDGEEWRPVAAVRGWYEAPAFVATAAVVPLVLLVTAFAGGGLGVWALAILAEVAWIVLVVRSRLLRARAKGLYVLLSVFGIGLEALLSGRDRRDRDGRVTRSASRL